MFLKSEMFRIGVLVLLLHIHFGIVWAQGLAQPREALKLITDTAREICVDLPLSASEQRITLSADASAKLAEVARKLADLGVSGAATFTRTDSARALLESDVLPAMKDQSACRIRIFERLESKLLAPPQKQGCTFEERDAVKGSAYAADGVSQAELEIPSSPCYRVFQVTLFGRAKAPPRGTTGTIRSKFVVEANGKAFCAAHGEYENGPEFASELKTCSLEAPVGASISLKAYNSSPSPSPSTEVRLRAFMASR